MGEISTRVTVAKRIPRQGGKPESSWGRKRNRRPGWSLAPGSVSSPTRRSLGETWSRGGERREGGRGSPGGSPVTPDLSVSRESLGSLSFPSVRAVRAGLRDQGVVVGTTWWGDPGGDAGYVRLPFSLGFLRGETKLPHFSVLPHPTLRGVGEDERI